MSNKREVLKNDQILCRACAFGTYYQETGDRKQDDEDSYAIGIDL